MRTTLVGCRVTNGVLNYTVIKVNNTQLTVVDPFNSTSIIDIATLNRYGQWILEEGQIWANTEAGITLKIVAKTNLDGVYLCSNSNNEEHRLVQIEYLQKNYVLLGFPVDTPQTVPTLDLQEQQTNLSEGEALLKFFATPTGQWKGYNND